MTATAAMRLELRRMCNLTLDDDTYTDDVLDTYIERNPSVDERGIAPYYYDVSTDPPQQVAMTGWIPSYDLASAASQIWTEKAALVVDQFSYPVEGGTYAQGQRHDHYMKQARYWAARRKAGTATLHAWPGPRPFETHIGNWPEID